MERYVGLDAHAETCTLAVLGATGRRLTSRVVETSAPIRSRRHKRNGRPALSMQSRRLQIWAACPSRIAFLCVTTSS